MGVFQLYREQKIPATVNEIWEFMSTPKNLKRITPKYMGFDIVAPQHLEKMHPGMIVIYKVAPFLNKKMTWVTEITHIREKEYFVDEQRVGPYKMWHHEHKLFPIENGVLMTDLVTYQPPLGFLGNLANKLIIKKQLNEIFHHRKRIVEQLYGKYNNS